MPRAPAPWAPPPYRELGGNNVYFKVLPGIKGLAGAWVEGFKLYRDLGTVKHPAAPQKRALLARHLAEMEKRIKAGEFLVAQKTDEYVRNRIRGTQVRPDNPHGPQMLTAIRSRPIQYPSLPAFAVGQVDMGILDKATTAAGSTKPYWPSQEFGSTHNVGRVIKGSFQPGNVAPDPAQFRVHPIFRTGGGSLMKIRRPIEERAFLRSGVMQAALLRQRMWQQMERTAVAEMARILGFGGPGAGGGRGGRRP